MESTRQSRPFQGKRKGNRYIPYDPLLAPGKLAAPDQWYVTPGEISNLNGEVVQQYRPIGQPSGKQGDLAGAILETEKIEHLLFRASFGPTVDEVQNISSLSIAEIVDALVADTDLPQPPGNWVNEPFDRVAFRNLTREEQQAWRRTNRQRVNELRGWWLQLMMSSAINLREKMTLFWHGHFTSDFQTVQLAQWLYMQNNTLRRHALGNFREFLKDIYKDPAMLIYLDGDSNKAAQPNENFARELLELFTMGVGNYSEDDIKEAARSFSGWQNNSVTLQSFFNPNRHDNGIKNFLGRSGNFAGDDIIDIILEQPQTALFIARKLFKFFVSREIDEPFVNDLANLFRSSDYEIKPVLRMIFTSNFFYSDQAVGSLIKGPVEMAVNNARIFSVDSIDLGYVLNATSDLNQELLSPPNVAGWPGQRGWISPTTYVTRNTFSESYVDGGLYNNPDSNRSPIVFDPLKFARSFGLSGATDLAQAMVAHLVRLPISEETMSFLISVLLGSAAVDDWSLDYPGADRLVKEFLVQVTRLPEFHLT